MSYAEVSLTLDNREEDGFSRLASEYDEVTVTRRYNRNGTSEYMINRRPVRLKDINTLFMNTGIGRDGYSIVSQGKAAEIISQKSDERRNVFEEAAGISKYRYQKNDAEKKLAETAQNCERLADILLEKKTNLDKLEKDAEKAKKYLDVYEKKKEADISLLVYEKYHTVYILVPGIVRHLPRPGKNICDRPGQGLRRESGPRSRSFRRRRQCRGGD